MAEVLLFNHIPKTAGSTMRHVLFRVVGKVGFATTKGRHRQDVATLQAELGGSEPPNAIVAHTGFGLHERLPANHLYRQLTFLRDPVERTVSNFFYARDAMGHLDPDMTLGEFLEEEVALAYNLQTAFLGGLTIRHQLDGRDPIRSDFDSSLLDRAKEALAQHEVVGFTERFDQSLGALRENFGWPFHRTLYVSINRGKRPSSISPADRRAVRQANELDSELYAHAQANSPLPGSSRTFRQANQIYRRVHSAAQKARSIART